MDTPYPSRKRLDHRGPLSIGTTDAVYFITIAAAERGTSEMSDKADVILSAARYYQSIGKWFLHILLIMPDHIHMLVHVPTISVGRDVLDAPQPRQNENSFESGCGVPGGHALPPPRGLAKTIGDFKSYLSKRYGIRFQANFFDTRIRDQEHFAEKWNYICQNPVAKGLVHTAREWPHSIAYDPATGQERPHR